MDKLEAAAIGIYVCDDTNMPDRTARTGATEKDKIALLQICDTLHRTPFPILRTRRTAYGDILQPENVTCETRTVKCGRTALPGTVTGT